MFGCQNYQKHVCFCAVKGREKCHLTNDTRSAFREIQDSSLHEIRKRSPPNTRLFCHLVDSALALKDVTVAGQRTVQRIFSSTLYQLVPKIRNLVSSFRRR